MTNKKTKQAYLCSSADWDRLVTDAESPLDAAAQAMEEQMDAINGFSVGPVITITPVSLKTKDTHYAYAPFVLAEMGHHKFSAEVAKELEVIEKAIEDQDAGSLEELKRVGFSKRAKK
jgi:hypothetical protein